MRSISFEKFNLNHFWEQIPSALKYILVFAIFIVVSYFLFSKRMDDNHIAQIEQMERGIEATYELIDNFDNFKIEQEAYNKEVLEYLSNLQSLVEDLNATTSQKLDMLLSAENSNSEEIIEKILLLNESFERLSRTYQENLPVIDTLKKNN